MVADSLPKFTWQEVAKHNTDKSMWVINEGSVYDVTDWIPNHPGGKEILMLAAGRDVTDLMTSYHPFTEKAAKTLAGYKIGEVEGEGEFPSFAPDKGFYKTLRARVNDYFVKNKLDPKSPWAGLWRMALVFTTAFTAFAVMHGALLPGTHMAVRALAAFVFGVCQALPLLHVMHDASHTAIGHNETWWKVVGRLTMDWYAGASMISWHHQHTIGHHVYTNVMGLDPDLPVTDKGDMRRLVSKQVWTWMYKFQHIYLPIVYGLLGLKFRKKKVAVVTGSNKGIGYEIVRGLSKMGYQVVLAARNPELGKSACEQLCAEENTTSITYHQLDITDGPSIDALANTLSKNGGFDVLVNNAAIAYKGNTFGAEECSTTIRTNVYGTIDVCDRLCPLIRPGGVVVNVCSMAGRLSQVSEALQQRFTSPSLTPDEIRGLMEKFVEDVRQGQHKQEGWSDSMYGISKLGAIAYTNWLASATPLDKFRVHAMCPGYCDTDMTSHKGPRTPAKGAETVLWLVDEATRLPEGMETGGFFSDCAVKQW